LLHGTDEYFTAGAGFKCFEMKISRRFSQKIHADLAEKEADLLRFEVTLIIVYVNPRFFLRDLRENFFEPA
jgi:hypothetical protein